MSGTKKIFFGYYDKEMISSGINLDWFIGDRQEVRLKGKFMELRLMTQDLIELIPLVI